MTRWAATAGLNGRALTVVLRGAVNATLKNTGAEAQAV